MAPMLWRLRAFPDFCEPCLPSPGSSWRHKLKFTGLTGAFAFRRILGTDAPAPPTQIECHWQGSAASYSAASACLACTHKLAKGESGRSTSALAHLADSSRTSPEVREVPEADIAA